MSTLYIQKGAGLSSLHCFIKNTRGIIGVVESMLGNFSAGALDNLDNCWARAFSVRSRGLCLAICLMPIILVLFSLSRVSLGDGSIKIKILSQGPLNPLQTNNQPT